MDTELAKHLSKLNESLGRIDERTIAIHDNQKALASSLKDHEKDNRSDFRGVHGRINHVEKKQSWMMGIGTAVMAGVTALSGVFTGMFGG